MKPSLPEMPWSQRGWSSERPGAHGKTSETYCYTDRFSYMPGEEVTIHGISTSQPTVRLRITRDGHTPEVLVDEAEVAAGYVETPLDAYASGCGWPEIYTMRIPEHWRSGFYIVSVSVEGTDGLLFERDHFFVVRPGPRQPRKPLVLLLTTSTLIAYNDWGGANQYRGIGDDPRVDVGAVEVSIHRPVGRGFVRLPVDAPREARFDNPPPFFEPRYTTYEWAKFTGHSRHYGDAFWASFERDFVVWAEENGYELDYVTQHDLDRDPQVLDGHACVVIVGHDEYWSWRMRDTLDEFLDHGGNLARFAGNMHTQIRLENEGATQALYRVADRDPVFNTKPQLSTTYWSHPAVNRPAPLTFGLRATGYARYGNTTPRSAGGYTVYRPHHWVFDGTDLYYGDMIGAVPVGIVSFEVDGVHYTFDSGLPVPTGEDGAPPSLEILAMAPAVAGEEDRWSGRVPLNSGLVINPATGEAVGGEVGFEGRASETTKDPYAWSYGAAMMATFQRGQGTVFNAGTCEWKRGLTQHDWFVEKITHNILQRLGRPPEQEA